MRHGAGASLLQRQAGLGPVERLDLALLVDRQHDGMRRRVDIEPDHVAQLVDELRVVESLNCRTRCGCNPWRRRMRWTELMLMPAVFAIIAPVQCVASPGGSARVSAMTRSATGSSSGAIHEGRVLSRRRPSTPPLASWRLLDVRDITNRLFIAWLALGEILGTPSGEADDHRPDPPQAG